MHRVINGNADRDRRDHRRAGAEKYIEQSHQAEAVDHRDDVGYERQEPRFTDMKSAE